MSTQTDKTNKDRLLTRKEVSVLLCSNCKSGHVIRKYAKNGLIREIKFNSRCIRYSEASVLDFINGKKTA
jgi:hypothetical protein